MTVDETGAVVGDAEADPEVQMDAQATEEQSAQEPEDTGSSTVIEDPPAEPRKFYIDGGEVEVIGHLV